MYKSTFGGMNTALRGLLAQQAAMDVTGHNLANVNTEGYTRQRAELVASSPYTLPAMNRIIPSQIGTGVEVSSFERLRDQFVDISIRANTSDLADTDRMIETLEQVEGAFGEPGDSGLSALMRKFWSAMDDLATHPDDMGARAAFARAGDALARGFNAVGQNILNLEAQANSRIDAEIAEVNLITTQIAALNTSIRDAVAMGQQPNDLRDQRDLLMDELSGYLNYTYTENAAGEVTITFGTTTPIVIVDPAVPPGSTALTRANVDAAFGNLDLAGGSLHADEEMWSNTLPNVYRANLDTIVADFVGNLNALHAAGFDLNGGTGLNDLFVAGGTLATSMQFNPAVLADPRLIAAASSWAGTGEPGNNVVAQNMLGQRNALQVALGNVSWETFYTGTVTTLGTQTATEKQMKLTQEGVLSVLRGRRDEVSGVSLDEEMSNLLRFQNAYNASARVLTSMDDAIDTIINRMGRAGL